MKAIAYIFFGILGAAACGYQALLTFASGSFPFLSIPGTVIGLVFFFSGLATNHRQHTRRF